MLHPFYREPALSEFRHVRLLPHGNQWHAPFTVRHADWVYVWHPHEDPAEGCERFWIEAGCRWSPRVASCNSYDLVAWRGIAAGFLPPLAMTVGATLCSSLSRARRMFYSTLVRASR